MRFTLQPPDMTSGGFFLSGVPGLNAEVAGDRPRRMKVATISVHALTSLPILFSHTGYSAEELRRAGVDEGMVRMSVGLEDPEDLIADLRQALE